MPIKIETEDKMGLLQLILTKITDNKINITFANCFQRNAKKSVIELGLEVQNIDSLTRIMNAIEAMPEVISVKRTHASQNIKRKGS